MANIDINNLTVAFAVSNSKEYVIALDHISTSFKHGSINVILGGSGSGKTTLLNAILGNVLINGDILVNGVSTKKADVTDLNISYVSQDFALYPQYNAYDNIAFPLKMNAIPGDEIKSRVTRIASLFGISDILNRLPKTMSIGQKQRVALARAFIKRSDIYLFDEPFSNLDVQIANEIKEVLRKAIKLYNATAIFVSHDSKDAFILGDKLVILNEGKIIFDGNPEDALKEKDENIISLFKE
ncbi:MAG: ABC transporter ATP-binding protein [Bacilli bacterium]|nr:ABC transporter ATP-binding protein [Bacilli bacterium]